MNPATKYIPEGNMRFNFMPKSFFPRLILSAELSSYLDLVEFSNPFFVILPRMRKIFEERISEANCFEVKGEPTLSSLEILVGKVSEQNDVIIACGGGSVLDLAKALKKDLKIPLIVCPTTPSTGSETTQYALLIEDKTKNKTLIKTHRILPDVVIYDWSLLKSIPKEQMGYFLFDILGHSFEALVSRMASVASGIFAKTAIGLVVENYKLLEPPYPREAIEKIQLSGFFAGLAQGMASVGMAHSFAHYFGPHFGIGHARAVSIFLLDVLGINMKLSDPKLKEAKELLGGIRKHFKIELDKISIGSSFNLEEAIQMIKKDFCTPTNPVRFSDDVIREIIYRHTKKI